MIFENKVLKVKFDPEGGGFPTSVAVKYPFGETITVIKNNKPFLSIGIGNGKTVSPFLPDGYVPVKSEIENCQRLYFDRLGFRSDDGMLTNDFFLSLRYEFYDNGTVFIQSFFICEKFNYPAVIDSYKFEIPFDFESFSQINMPTGANADLCDIISQASGHSFEQKGIKKVFNFNCKRKDNVGGYFEVFMEDTFSLAKPRDPDEDSENKQSSITWNGNSPTVSWDFQTSKASPLHRDVWQQFNQWGFLFTAPPVFRRNPPLRMYHINDFFDYRVPTIRQIDLMSEAGADLVILHELWRSDVSYSAFPYNRKRLLEFINYAHKKNMRVALYVRGYHDRSTIEDACNWFGEFLRKDWDGIYMDFAGALHAPCGLKQHYLTLRRIRKEVGEHGLIFAHSGALGSGLGLTPDIIDGYTAGEGEEGALSTSRFMHECLSGSYLTTGTFWTAAFPHYGDGRIIPFMAAAGQYPHAPLGVQIKSSSLAHPGVPGLNDVYLRPLWKIWGTFKDMHDIEFYNDFNSRGIIEAGDTENTGSYLMLNRNQSAALLVLSNFADQKRSVKVMVNWKKLDFEPGSAVLLTPDKNTPGRTEAYADKENLIVDIPSSGCAGFLFGAEKSIKDFEEPYPSIPEEVEKYKTEIEKQKKLRYAPETPQEKLFLKIEIPEYSIPCYCCRGYYNAEHEIGTIDAKNNFTMLGYITKNGFMRNKPKPMQCIWAGDSSPWIDMHEILPNGGKKHIVIKTRRTLQIDYFHSCIEVLLSLDAGEQHSQRLVFFNEVEPEREALHFEINLIPKENS